MTKIRTVAAHRARPSAPLLPLLLALLLPPLLAGCSAHREAGTGDVAFRLVWDGQTDLDLLVVDPSGECVFFANDHSPTGAILDVDCNAGTDRLCEHPIENVFWPVGTAPAGQYRIWVRAHGLIPAEAPLPYRLLVLHGVEPAWSRQATVEEPGELHGPFTWRWPEGGMHGPPEAAAAPAAAPNHVPPTLDQELPRRCDPWQRMLMEAEEGAAPEQAAQR